MSAENQPGKYPRQTSLDFLNHCSPRVASFYRYWEGKKRGRTMPSRSDLDPVEMKGWLPGITLVDVLSNPRRLIYRLVGTRITELRGRDVTGICV